jgi:phosphonate transport system substrate-binding protein
VISSDDAAGRVLRRLRRAALAVLVLGLVAMPGATARAEENPKVHTHRLRLSLDYLGAATERDALAVFQAFCDRIAEVVTERYRPMKAVVRIAPSLEALIREFEDGAIESAYLSAYEYVRVRERVMILPLTMAVRSTGRHEHRGLLVVRADDPAKSIRDMRGRRFVYMNQTSTYGYLYPQWLLCTIGEPDLCRFFGKSIRVTKEMSAVYGVLLGDADVASVSDYLLDTLFDLKPALRRKLRVLHRSDPLPLGVFAVAPSVAPDLRAILEESICDEDSLVTELRESLRFIKVAGMRRTKDADFDSVRDLVRFIDASQERHVCPVCGLRLSDKAVGAELGEGNLRVRFCGDRCRSSYREQGERAKPGAEDPLIVIGLDSALLVGTDPRDARALYEYLIGDALERYGLKCLIQFVSGHDLIRARLKDKTLSVVHLSGPSYVRMAEETEILPLIRTERNSPSFRACLVVSARSTVERLSDLRGKTLGVRGQGEASSDVFLRTLLRPLGANSPSAYFRTVMSCPTQEAAIRAVAFGDADAALVKSEAIDLLRDLKPAVFRKLRVLCRSEQMFHGPVCCRSDLRETLERAVIDSTTRLHKSPKGRAVLSSTASRRIVAAKDSDYDSIRSMLRKRDD